MTTKKLIKIIPIFVILIALFTAGFVIINKLTAPVTAEEPRNVPGPELKVGRYYVDGDTEQYYLEVTKEGTIQLKDVDYFEYASYGNEEALKTRTGKDLEELKANLQKRADKLSQPIKYRSIIYPGIEETAILTSWGEDEMGNVSGSGYAYVDENTLTGGGKTNDSLETFKFVDETSYDKLSVKTDKPTRFVDSLTYKQKNGIE
ncbi:MAG TPA: hypothetical protein PKI60_04805 [Oscillospiraceae bacterium]|nr:hypothetical protein [Oscillospiraceae bacterium]